jgi:hypothetical protein
MLPTHLIIVDVSFHNSNSYQHHNPAHGQAEAGPTTAELYIRNKPARCMNKGRVPTIHPTGTTAHNANNTPNLAQA